MKPTSNGGDKHVSNKGFGDIPSLLWSFVSPLKDMKCTNDTRRVIHAFKVAVALVLISLLYLLNPLFEQLGENAMWAIMTVVVMFEFYAGATLSKGINRGIGTLVGGGLGCLAAVLADEIGGIGNPIIVACSVFVFGGAATYCRMVPKLKKSHDYGFMISILTFNLVAVSGVRADKVVEMAGQRLANIGMGFTVSVFVNLLVSPMWSSDELHYSIASKFGKLASSIEGCIDEYFKMTSEKEDKASSGKANPQACKPILNSKSNEESLANFAKWEPWHGKFGYNHPWQNYLEVGEHLREVAALILSLHECLHSPKQPQPVKRQRMKEPCEVFMLSILWALKELGSSIENMEHCQANALLSPKFQSMKLQLAPLYAGAKSESLEPEENLAVTSFNFLMMEIVEKVERLGKKVEQLGEVANFRARKVDV